MKYKTVIISVVILSVVGMIGYEISSYMKKMEVNTVSPQTSSSIAESKKNNLFKQSYMLETTTAPTGFTIKEAWIEDVWKNSFKNGEQQIEKLGGVQLAVNTTDLGKYGYDDETFLLDWTIKLDRQILQGSGKGNGLYVFYLKDMMLSEKIEVTVIDKSNQGYNRKQITFKLKQSNITTQ